MAKDNKKSASQKFMQPMQISEELAAVVGKGPMPRTEVTKKLWAYIKTNRRQDPKKKEKSSLMKNWQKYLALRSL